MVNENNRAFKMYMLKPLIRWIVIVFFLFVFSFTGKALFGQDNSKNNVANTKTHLQETEKNSNIAVHENIWQRTMEDPVAFFTGLLALFTLLLVLISSIQIGFLIRADRTSARNSKAAENAAIAAQYSADVANRALIANQRAWVRPEVTISDQPLIFGEVSASTSISFRLTNVGNTPAVNVMPHVWLVALKPGGPFPIEEQKRRCKEIREQPIAGGFTLFPGEIFPGNLGFGKWSIGVNITREEIEKGLAISSDGKHISLYVIGCIDYTFPSDGKLHHQTEFIFELCKNEPNLISPDEGTIPVSSLVLRNTGIGSGQQAD
jgi:hypothetical protein